MSVIIFAELADGAIKKSSLEAIYYGASVAQLINTSATVVALGNSTQDELAQLGNFGANKVLWAANAQLTENNAQLYASILAGVVQQEEASVVIFAKSSLSDAVAARVAAKVQAAIVTNVTELPDLSGGFRVKRSIYTGKAFATVAMNSAVKVIGIKKNAIQVIQSQDLAVVEPFEASINEHDLSVKITATHKASGTVSLPEADLVVSAGRGLKAPENWGIVEDLAKALGAATACSKPVSDADWRPHHEHVGQTGLKVSPNLYIACGISGAIQHLAGVNSSKVIVVINKDPEAPFFKSADYGIVGDVFDILPRLTKVLTD
ncbi:MAG: electron transfer flavoprotein subunit alpha/FixB family protein [Spirosomataceae bacterium]